MYELFSTTTVEIQTVWLRSSLGYTPILLTDRTESLLKSKTNPRYWRLFMRTRGVSKRELIQSASTMVWGNLVVYWRRHLRPLNEADMFEWINNGVKISAPLEDVLSNNPGVECIVGDTNLCLSSSIQSTKELDDWILASKAYAKPFIEFSKRDRLVLSIPDPNFNENRKVLLKSRFRSFKMGPYYCGQKDDGTVLYGSYDEGKIFTEPDGTDLAIMLAQKRGLHFDLQDL